MNASAPLPRATLGVLALVSFVLVVVLHGGTLGHGLPLGDYALLRPFTPPDTQQVLTGPWAPTALSLGAYYRPLAAIFYGGVFDLLGVHALWLRALSLGELAVVLWLLAAFVARDAGTRAAVVTSLTLAVHPLLAPAATHATASLAHLTAMAVALLCLLRWQSVRHDQRLIRWWPVYAMIGLGAFLREDLLMLAPAVLALQWIRARTAGDVAPPNVAVTAGAVATLIGVASVRVAAYPHLALTATGAVSPFSLAHQAAGGALRVFLNGHGPAAIGAAIVMAGLAVAGVAAARRRRKAGLATTLACGAVLLFVWTLPLLVDPSTTDARLPLLVLASALLVGAGAASLATRIQQQALVVTILLVAAATMGVAQRVVTREVAPPCTAIATAPTALDGDITVWVAAEARACAGALSQPLDETTPAMQWNAGARRVLWLARDTTSVTFALAPPASLATDVELRIDVDGAPHTAWLRPGTLTRLTYRLRASPLLAPRGGHWLDFRTEADIDIPAISELHLTGDGPR